MAAVGHEDEFPQAGHGARQVDVAIFRVHRAAEPSVRTMMVVDRPLVAARHDIDMENGPMMVVDHDADRGEILIGVRVKRPILVPLDRCAIAGRLHVELAGVETQATPQVGQQLHDLGVAAGAHVDRVDRMGCLQPAHPGPGRRVRVLEVINRVVGGHSGRRRNELVGSTGAAPRYPQQGRRPGRR